MCPDSDACGDSDVTLPCTDGECDDGIDCTVDTCTFEGCTNVPDHDSCDDGNVCTDDVCTLTGCTFPFNSDPCDDGVYCNGEDTCSEGECDVHAGDPCAPAECNEASRGCIGSIRTVTAHTGGNMTPSARHTIVCVENGNTCTVESNRNAAGDRYDECSITCPEGSLVTECCSNGDYCGGSPAVPHSGREIDDFNAIGFATTTCTPPFSDSVIECDAVVGAVDARFECDFTD